MALRMYLMNVTVDNTTRVLLSAITVLLFFVALALWFESPNTLPAAQAKIPDSGQQLNEVISSLEKINGNLVDIKKLMTSGQAKVQIVTSDDVNSKATSRAAKTPSLKRQYNGTHLSKK